MTRLPALAGQRLIRALQRAGFEIARQEGSHVRLKHEDGRATTVQIHAGETIGPGLLSKILRNTKLNREDLSRLLE